MADIFKQYFEKFKVLVNKLYANTLFELLLNIVESKVGVQSPVIVMGLLGIIGIYLIFGWCNDFACNILALIFPIYATITANLSEDTSGHKYLLKYWMIYAVLGCIEYILYRLCNFLRVYWLAKFIFFVWFIKSAPAPPEPEPELMEFPDLSNSLQVETPSIPRKKVTVNRTRKRQSNLPARSIALSRYVKWLQNGKVVAGGNGNGGDLNQLYAPYNVLVDDDQNVYVVDSCNSRLVQWAPFASEGQIVVGGTDETNILNKLDSPGDVIYDKSSDTFIISETTGKKVVRWRRQDDTKGEVIISNFSCMGLATDEMGSIYMVDSDNHEVIRYNIGDTEATIVAGGNGAGDGLNQLNDPYSVFVDQDYSVYVSDQDNHRVMKWVDGATEGIVVAGGQGQGNGLSQLNYPRGIVVDPSGTVYVCDHLNGRVMRWFKGATEGEIVVSGNVESEEPDQLCSPSGLAFDSHGNLYVANAGRASVVKFEVA